MDIDYCLQLQILIQGKVCCRFNLQQKLYMMAGEQKEMAKYRIIAQIGTLHLNKNINFETKVSWKRNVNKVYTETVLHENGMSIFNETLELQISLVFNRQTNEFDAKYTEFAITVIYQGKNKSGGTCRYDVAQIINKRFIDEPVRLNFEQCPDPQAYLEVIFNYVAVENLSNSIFNEISILNPNDLEVDLSAIDFKDDQEDDEVCRAQKASLSPDRSGSFKFTPERPSMKKQENKYLPQQINSRNTNIGMKFCYNEDHNSTKGESLQISAINNEVEERLRFKIVELKRQIEYKDSLIQQYEERIESQGRQLEEMHMKIEFIQSKNQQYDGKKEPAKKIESNSTSEDSKFQYLYEKTLRELNQLRSQMEDLQFSKQNMGLNNLLAEINQSDEIPEFVNDKENNSYCEKIELLERDNVQLQTKIASMSHNIAQLFNAAYQFGGAKLLDYLQSSIGLIEEQS